MVGKTVLSYHVDEKIGSGGFGTVYRVSKTNASGTYVRALKHIALPTKEQYVSVLNSMGGDYSKADGYFAGILNDIVSEISILSTLSESGTKNIVRYYENDIVETNSPKTYNIYILMEFLTPFSNYTESNQFTVRDVFILAKDMLTALMDCHGKNIIHRDIKGDNIFVSADGVYKLGDFGVSKALNDKSRAESVKGTPNYIAPEVYLGREKYDNTVDLYSLGIVLYQLLNKKRNPFLPKYPEAYSIDDEYAAFEARMKGEIPELPIYAENELGKAVIKAILPRKDRYNSAKEFYNALMEVEKNMSETELSKDLGLRVPAELRSSSAPMQKSDVGLQNKEIYNGGTMQGCERTVAVDGNNGLFKNGVSYNRDYADSPNYGSNAFANYGSAGSANYGENRTFSGNGSNTSSNNVEYNAYAGDNADDVSRFESVNNNPYKNDSWGGSFNSLKLDKKPKSKFKWLLYLTPLLLVGVWIAVHVFLVDSLYVKTVSFIEWFIGNPSAIADKIKESENVLMPIYKIILLCAYNWLTAVGVITSLFFIGRQVQNSKPKQSNRAILCGKAPYTITLELLEEIKLIKTPGVEKARKAVYALNERLRNESDFGDGTDEVIDCENEIYSCLQSIKGLIYGLNDEKTLNDSTCQIESLAQSCVAKLKIRTELKKK